ncbi:hypothetical protein [Pararobbsia alpina]|uniref:Uncharacterized protein n=1 Tax=Pararobbsia alpina TaxID=621374 RepID=A0A6S7BIC8_9BURK|nr:hypothetical protein [Pararobbsia alpina]CAB3801138.1 hypothetical protein LMG28138_04949 [Pararobbsia alpina]
MKANSRIACALGSGLLALMLTTAPLAASGQTSGGTHDNNG